MNKEWPLNLGFSSTPPLPDKSPWTFITDELNTALKDKKIYKSTIFSYKLLHLLMQVQPPFLQDTY